MTIKMLVWMFLLPISCILGSFAVAASGNFSEGQVWHVGGQSPGGWSTATISIGPTEEDKRTGNIYSPSIQGFLLGYEDWQEKPDMNGAGFAPKLNTITFSWTKRLEYKKSGRLTLKHVYFCNINLASKTGSIYKGDMMTDLIEPGVCFASIKDTDILTPQGVSKYTPISKTRLRYGQDWTVSIFTPTIYIAKVPVIEVFTEDGNEFSSLSPLYFLGSTSEAGQYFTYNAMTDKIAAFLLKDGIEYRCEAKFPRERGLSEGGMLYIDDEKQQSSGSRAACSLSYTLIK